MAADYEQMAKNLRQFYPFSGHTVIGVGAGGGPLTAVVCEARKLIVIDNNPAAIRQWEARVAADQLQDRVEIVEADFCTVSPRGDVVYFEFCLHEMDDPALALKHAMTVAPDVVVFDLFLTRSGLSTRRKRTKSAAAPMRSTPSPMRAASTSRRSSASRPISSWWIKSRVREPLPCGEPNATAVSATSLFPWATA